MAGLSGVILTLVTAPAGAQIAGPLGMHVADPAIARPAQPFSFPSHPTDVIGAMDGRGTEVTPEGFLYTGYGEHMLFAGPGLAPLNARIKTLYREHLPVVPYGDTRAGVHHRVPVFATTLDGKPESPLVNFIRLDAHNPLPTWARPRSGPWRRATTRLPRIRRPAVTTASGARTRPRARSGCAPAIESDAVPHGARR